MKNNIIFKIILKNNIRNIANNISMKSTIQNSQSKICLIK